MEARNTIFPPFFPLEFFGHGDILVQEGGMDHIVFFSLKNTAVLLGKMMFEFSISMWFSKNVVVSSRIAK